MTKYCSDLGVWVTLIFIGIAIFEIVAGYHRGILKTLFNKVILAVATVAGFIVSPGIAKNMVRSGAYVQIFKENTIASLFSADRIKVYILDATAEYGDIGQEIISNPTLSAAIESIPDFVSSLIVFPFVTAILYVIGAFIYMALKNPISHIGDDGDIPVPPSFISKVVGALLSCALSFAIFVAFMTPISGAARVASYFNGSVGRVKSAYTAYTSKLVPRAIERSGLDKIGENYVRSVSEYQVDYKTFYLTDDAKCLAEVLEILKSKGVIDDIYSSVNADKLLEYLSDEEMISDVYGSIERSEAMGELSKIAARYAAKKALEETLKNIIPIGNAGSSGVVDSIITEVSSDIDKLGIDLPDLKNIGDIVASKISEGIEKISDKISDSEIVESLEDDIDKVISQETLEKLGELVDIDKVKDVATDFYNRLKGIFGK